MDLELLLHTFCIIQVKISLLLQGSQKKLYFSDLQNATFYLSTSLNTSESWIDSSINISIYFSQIAQIHYSMIAQVWIKIK